MPVDTQHETYTAAAKSWLRCRDAVAGLDAVRERGGDYIPVLAGQNTQEYTAYKKRADWYGATGRTVQGLSGAAFRKEISLELPDALEDWREDVTLTGIPAKTFCRVCLDELLEVGRRLIYVDMPAGEEAGADARPYLVGVDAEAVVDWRESRKEGRQIITQVRIREDVFEEDADGDAFTREKVEQYRVLEVLDGVYSIQLWRRKKEDSGGQGDWIPYDEPVIPKFRDRDLLQVPELANLTGGGLPVWFLNPADLTPKINKPPLKDLADLNLSLYRNSADLENALHFTGFPQPVAAGFPAKTQLHIGTARAWVSSDAGAKAYYMEYSGQGLDAVLANMERKKHEMAAMGARLLEEQKKAQEAAETLRLRQSGEQATLVGMIEVVETAVKSALSFAITWAGQSADKLRLEINKDLVAIRANPQELAALNASLQAGAISYATYYHNLEQLELTRPGVDAEEEQETIDADTENIFQQRAQGGRLPDNAEEIDEKVANIGAA